MTFTLAFRNLFHDRMRLAVTLVGILFSIVLVAVQLGLYLGARNIIISMIDRADGDLWIMAYGTKNFEEAQPISVREKFAALSTPGVAKATPLIASFTDWRKPTGGSTLGRHHRRRLPKTAACSPGTSSRAMSRARRARCRDRSTRPTWTTSASTGTGDTAQIGASARARHRAYGRHPLLHRHALRLHARSTARAPCSTCRPTRSPTCWSSSSRAPTSEAVRNEIREQGARQRGADQGRVPRRAASTTGCLPPAPAWR